jgi:hypothetical protein
MPKHNVTHRRKVIIYGKPRYQIVNAKGQIMNNENIARAQKADRAKKAKTIVRPGQGFRGDQKKKPKK